ncbi:MAG TPA: ABATE domain-containing protein [Myxococcales bacterium]|nr:ABATE domain-containing protein [Myxococcales bacterium]
MPGARAERFRFDLDGGTVALDFVNTVSGLRGVRPRERLSSYEDLVYWARQVRLIDKVTAERLYLEANRNPNQAEEAFGRALLTREALNDLVVAGVEREPPPETALAIVNAWISEALARRRLVSAGRGKFAARFAEDGDLLAFLRPVALDAAEVLEHELRTALVRQCAQSLAGECGWLFLDQTRNHSRRYCSMKECGNRAKQRRHYQRRKLTS